MTIVRVAGGAGGSGGSGTPPDGSVTNVKVATGAAISADKLADGTTNKVFLGTERTKLTGVAPSATANSTDATLLARANHTGTQSADTLVDGTTNHVFTVADDIKLGGIATAANVGYATVLDEGGVLTARTALNFTGLGVTATDDSGTGRTLVTIPGAAGGSGTVTGWFNVKDYGAVGNGSTNDTAAINSALSAASAAGGGVVFFPAGTYMTNGGHTWPAYVHILGSEPASRYWAWSPSASPPTACALKLRTGTSATTMLSGPASLTAGSLRDISLLGDNIGSGIDGITFADPSTEHNLIINNVAIIGFTGDGVRGSTYAQRWHQMFVGGCAGWGWTIDGSNEWTDMIISDCFVAGNKLGAFNCETTGFPGFLSFTNVRFERSGYNSNAPGTPTNTGSPGIQIRGRLQDCSFVGCTTDANSGFGLDIDQTTTSGYIVNLQFVNCTFRRDGFGDMVTLGNYAAARVRGIVSGEPQYITLTNCHLEAGNATDGGGTPSYQHPKYGLWAERNSFNSFTGGGISGPFTTLLYGGSAGWSTNWRWHFSIPGQGIMTVPRWDNSASRPTPVITGLVGMNDTTGKLEIYTGSAWQVVTSA